MNNLLVIEFEDRHSGLGIAPAALSLLVEKLEQSVGLTWVGGGPVDFVLVFAQPGALRLGFRAVKAEFEKGPLQATVNAISVGGVVSTLFLSLIKLGLATPSASIHPQEIIINISPPQANSCVALITALQSIDEGRVTLHAPDCPTLVINKEAGDPNSGFDRLMSASADEGVMPFTGAIRRTEDASFLSSRMRDHAFMANIGENGDLTDREVLVLWGAGGYPPVQGNYEATGTLMPLKKAMSLGLIEFDRSVISNGLAHRRIVVFIVERSSWSHRGQ